MGNGIREAIGRMWRASAALTAAGFAMLGVLVLTLIGLAVDPRIVGGAPLWLKPAKFAISTAIYALTFAWIFTYLEGWPRLRRRVGRVTAAVLVLEVALISLQAARGVGSHFNVGSAFDGAVFSTMGIAIVVAWAVSVALAVALFRQPFEDRAFGWALRLGLLITVIGSASGGLMVAPTSAQLEAARATGRLPLAGQHTVGAPDGGPGLPGTMWSTEHGDLRVAHFAGLHAVQLLPLLAFVLRRVAPEPRRTRIVVVASASYLSLFVLLLTQALVGQSVVAPAGSSAAALVVWAALSTLAVAVAARWPRYTRRPLPTAVVS